MSNNIKKHRTQYSSLNQLNDESKISYKGKRPWDVYKRLSTIRSLADKHRATGNEEQAYIFFKRWLNCVNWLKTTKEYKDDKVIYATSFPDSQVNEVKKTIDDLGQSLQKCYNIENNIKASAISDTISDMQLDIEPLSEKDINALGKDLILSFPETPTEDPLTGDSDETITCVQLYQLMQKLENRILLIDIRGAEDFQSSQINSNRIINIPASQIKLGVLASHFEKYLRKDKHALELFKCRGAQYVDTVVLLDWNTNQKSLSSSNRLTVFKKILKEWDPGMPYKKITILDGGYSEWLNSYPAFTTNPNIKSPNTHEDAMDEILEEVEYPDWLHSDDEDNPLKSMQIKPMPPRNLKPNLSDIKQTVRDKPSLENQVMDNTRSSYIISNTHSHTNYPDHAQSYADSNKFKHIENIFDLQENQKKTSHSLKNESSDVDIVLIEQDEKTLQSKKSSNKSSINESTIPKPIVDRSSKPTSLTMNNNDSEAVMVLMRRLNEVTKSQEKYEKVKFNLESELFRRYDDETRYSNEEHEIESRINQLGSNLEDMRKQNPEIRQELAKFQKDDVILNPAHQKEKVKLDLSIGSAEQRLREIAIERKKLYGKVPEREEKKKFLIKKPNEDEIHKEPLKMDGPSSNGGLKRSYSSPNLAQLDDRKVPEVDRSSKPQQQNNRNQAGLNNNSNVKYAPISWRDREQRMDPVFRTVHPGITGLKNLGNSCYMNSIIQCLSNTACLAKYFNDNMYLDELNTSNENGTQGQVAEEVAQVIKALWRGQYKSISPRDLKVVIGQYKLQFESYEQQDSHEFLTFLLDWMHNDLKRKVKVRIDRPLSVAEKEWDKAMGNQRSIISDLFFGQLRSSIFCATCGNSSTTYETFNSLTMSLPHSNRCTLNDCIKKFVSGQKVSGWKCPSCKVAREATKKFDFVKLAPIVVVHLNRFGESDGWLEKRNTAVDFPLTGFNLKPYLVTDGDNTTTATNPHHYNYNLYAMSNHYGTMEGGHYTAFCRSATQNKWYKYDDHTVTEVSPGQVKSQNASAYLLFYTSFPNDPYTFI
ncbi:ubiquitin carboxyl-terminal hydrolase 8 isoform X2 [Cephus cinctus]|uniref:ubiquitinyl hydrolase 1 n=1 Tax=Cephus cinctus TaxID=211228 RepID=A0AAJ7RM98_CEPCN|nr:ubiquitin carboxyl-terminal hydrolase 8 isoform X2 [Cephus cinctus]